jgi:L-aspartate oxidase
MPTPLSLAKNGTLPEIMKTDVLVIGSGLAGLLVTYKLIESGVSVILASKDSLSESNSSYAQGGIAASLPINQFDSPQLHLKDTIAAGAGLVDPAVAREIIFAGSKLIEELERLGVVFDHGPSGALALAREGGHSRNRVVHNRDTTGQSLTGVLIEKLRLQAQELARSANSPHLQLLANAFVLHLLVNEGVCSGARIIIDGVERTVIAQHTIVATGGLGQIYARTTNPAIATGDGIALAYRAGATLVDMEFIQFHPTALALPNAPVFLISEAVRGAGAILLDGEGEPFMRRFHEEAELATRDVVARAIHTIMKEQNRSHVLLDLRPIGSEVLSSRFPNILSVLRNYGVDPACKPVPVSPAAHYFMGGIATDSWGNTSIERLSAIGECASVGLHGANRLASNSLLEAGVMAMRTADYLITRGSFHKAISASGDEQFRVAPHMIPTGSSNDLDELRRQMYLNVSLIRTQATLSTVLDRYSHLQIAGNSKAEVQAANMHLLAQLITQTALMRRESRGAHFREDFPKTNDALFRKRLTVQQGEYRWASVEKSRTERRRLDQSIDRLACATS